MTDDSVDLSSQPNDAYFKRVFSRTEHATAFFKRHLPPDLAAVVKWETLTLLPGNFVKSSLQQRQSDLLFSLSAGKQNILLYLLFEHQTTVAPDMPLRLLAYLLEIWQAHQRQHGLPLPAVIPFVLHQGPEVWSVSTRFEDLIDLPSAELRVNVMPFLPKFTHALLDLSQFDPATQESDSQIQIILQLMKLARQKRLLDFFQWLAVHVVEPLPGQLLRDSLTYALHADSRLDVEQIYHTLESQPALREEAMSIAQQLIAQGKREGKAEGKAEGKVEGKAEGKAEGRLQLLQELMGLPVSSSEELARLTIDEVEARFHDLQTRYEDAFKGPRQ